MRVSKESAKVPKSIEEPNPSKSEDCTLVGANIAPKKERATVVWPDKAT